MGVPGVERGPGTVEGPAVRAQRQLTGLEFRLREGGRHQDTTVGGDALQGATRNTGDEAAVPADPVSFSRRLPGAQGGGVSQEQADEGEELSDRSEASHVPILLPGTRSAGRT
ncbi:hypothetical protein GCM10008939_23720 [Deinococcus aquiradiocola]|uniref:Uncharacterized protein n=1 Tax=Deinococcus aquiradiocola TaxID=393059 RepID=A0A917PHM1_9DEIO|nr:hypothetical protein GCM10008939_23720 [Deinococcus aquiradiocola]